MASRKFGIVDFEKYELPEELAEQFVEEGYNVRSNKQDEAYKKKMDNKNNIEFEAKFVNSLDEQLNNISQRITLSELGLFASLLPFMDFKTKNIIWRGKPMTQSDVSLALAITPYTVSRNLNNLVDAGFMRKDKNGKGAIYEINEEVAFIGEYLKREYSTKIFTVQFKKLCEGLKLNEIGLFYRLIPKINTERYILSYNPYELDTSKIQPITSKSAIADSIEMDRTTVNKHMKKLINNGLMFNFKGKKNVFICNPSVVSRKPKMESLEKIIEVVQNEYT